MPNHTSTVLELRGNKADIERFKLENRDKKSSFSFETGYPMPSEEEAIKMLEGTNNRKQHDVYKRAFGGTVSSGFTPLCYIWRTQFWGTKWDCYDVGEWTEENTLTYKTAWSPATPYYLHISKSYPDIAFKHTFADEGGSFIGYEIIKNGSVTTKLDVDWNSEEGVKMRNTLGVNYEDVDTTG